MEKREENTKPALVETLKGVPTWSDVFVRKDELSDAWNQNVWLYVCVHVLYVCFLRYIIVEIMGPEYGDDTKPGAGGF